MTTKGKLISGALAVLGVYSLYLVSSFLIAGNDPVRATRPSPPLQTQSDARKFIDPALKAIDPLVLQEDPQSKAARDLLRKAVRNLNPDVGITMTITEADGTIKHVLIKNISGYECVRLEVSDAHGETVILSNATGRYIIVGDTAIQPQFLDRVQADSYGQGKRNVPTVSPTADSYSLINAGQAGDAAVVSYSYDPATVAAARAMQPPANAGLPSGDNESYPVARHYYVDAASHVLISDGDVDDRGKSIGPQVTYQDPGSATPLDDSLFALPAAIRVIRPNDMAGLHTLATKPKGP